MSDDPGIPEDPDAHSYGLVCEFWIDTEAYSDRDRNMFVAGYEFRAIMDHARHVDGPLSTTIHRENESRVRMMCGRSKRRCTIEPCEAEQDQAGTWSYLEIEARTQQPRENG